jgi:hypothetical protein
LLLYWSNNPGVIGDKASCGATESCCEFLGKYTQGGSFSLR